MADARVTQVAVETLTLPLPDARVTQTAFELLTQIPAPSAPTITLVAEVHTGRATTSTNGGTSAAIDTTGATLIVISVSWASNPITLSDSKGNTWTALTQRTFSFDRHQLFYRLTPTVGAGHTFSVTGTSIVAGWHVYAFAGVASYQTESGASAGSGNSLACGAVTPTLNGALLVTGLCSAPTAAETDAAGPEGTWVRTQISYVASNQIQASAAYSFQGVAAAINPTWTMSGTPANVCVGAAVFLPSAVTPAAAEQVPV
jgi:hypothetical protein